ncbi:Cap-Gly Domain-Containing Linker Protein 2 [Manis pentadactyla]|nr:Cap-Gly Domain-Containing Linker Protein 2 [Manis pentadactyla]
MLDYKVLQQSKVQSKQEAERLWEKLLVTKNRLQALESLCLSQNTNISSHPCCWVGVGGPTGCMCGSSCGGPGCLLATLSQTGEAFSLSPGAHPGEIRQHLAQRPSGQAKPEGQRGDNLDVPDQDAQDPTLESKCKSGEKKVDTLQKKWRLEAELEAVSRKTHDASGQLVLVSQELLRKERSLNKLRVLLLEASRHSPGLGRDLSCEVHKAEW